MSDDSMVQAILDGKRSAVARAITMVETGGVKSYELLQSIHAYTGAAYRLGITGPPGVGKSTLTNQLIAYFRGQDKMVAVLAIDPSSPYTRGALLGDRLRMTEGEQDSGVFIRSMASRGSLGGLSVATHDAANILDAAGFDYVLIETVGVGQSELDVAGTADTVMVVLVPESGDSVQAMKAGLMEIADFFILNKCDRPDSGAACAAIQSMLSLRPQSGATWLPEVVRTIASAGEGIELVAEQIRRHRDFLNAKKNLAERREQRLRSHIRGIAEKNICADLWDSTGSAQLTASIQQALDGKLSPYELAQSIVENYAGNSKSGH